MGKKRQKVQWFPVDGLQWTGENEKEYQVRNLLTVPYKYCLSLVYTQQIIFYYLHYNMIWLTIDCESAFN